MITDNERISSYGIMRKTIGGDFMFRSYRHIKM